MTNNTPSPLVKAAMEAARRGYQPIPIIGGQKRPGIPGWQNIRWASMDMPVEQAFTEYEARGLTNLGVLLGEPSGGLVDVDIDHPLAYRLRDNFLPPTRARSGRTGRRSTHWWYVCEPETLPGRTRQHKMPDGAVSVELRSTLGQTLVAPSRHPSGDDYLWDFEPWGGDKGPTLINGKVLAAQVALLGLGAVLLENWPGKGSRHDAYLALAGSLLWDGELRVHPFWRTNIGVLIEGLCDATNDDDGPQERYKESVLTTIANIEAGNQVVRMGRLSEILGQETVKHVRALIADVETAAGYTSRNASANAGTTSFAGVGQVGDGEDPQDQERAAKPASNDPLSLRGEITWQAVDTMPYISGQYEKPEADILRNVDGNAMFYSGLTNLLVGTSESGKSWIALYACAEQIALHGHNVMFVDLEDMPGSTIERMQLLHMAKEISPGKFVSSRAVDDEDLQRLFTYVHPEHPIASLERNSWGKEDRTELGELNAAHFAHLLDTVDPRLIVIDGLTELYALHGLSPNGALETAFISRWVKGLTRNGRTTVIVIDHNNKGAGRGEEPGGSQHKKSMLQGSLVQAWGIDKPRKGRLGKVEMLVLKDRPGAVREWAEESGIQGVQRSGFFMIDSTTPGQSFVSIDTPVLQINPTQVKADLSRQRAAAYAEMVDKACLHIKGLYVNESADFSLRFDELASMMPDDLPMARNSRGELKLGKGFYGSDALNFLLNPPDGRPYLEERRLVDRPGRPLAYFSTITVVT